MESASYLPVTLLLLLLSVLSFQATDTAATTAVPDVFVSPSFIIVAASNLGDDDSNTDELSWNWYQASQYCQDEFGSDLGAISDDEAQSEFEALFSRTGRSTDTTIWIGLNDIVREGTWQWPSPTGAANSKYTNWHIDARHHRHSLGTCM